MPTAIDSANGFARPDVAQSEPTTNGVILRMAQIPTTRFCTIAEIAGKTGLGTTTVHRALRNEACVSEEARNAIRAAIIELNEDAIRRYRQELASFQASLHNPSARVPGGREHGGPNPAPFIRQENS